MSGGALPAAVLPNGGIQAPRVLGHCRGDREGPLLIAVAGLHGNEVAGVGACQIFLEALDAAGGPARGDVLMLAGNRGALAAGVRWLDLDMNRVWRRARLARLVQRDRVGHQREDAEQRALLAALDQGIRSARGPIRLVDLHTMSGAGPPFATTGDTLTNRRLARLIPVPLVLGLEEQVEGTLLEYFTGLGHGAVAVEGGQHRDGNSVDGLEAALWCVATGLEMVPRELLPRAEAARHRLIEAARGAPAVVEMRYRHRLADGSGYRTRPGYRSFDPVRAGEVVADSAAGPVRVRMEGRILMPLYQQQGDDGFFLVSDVRPVWLGVSSLLRRLRADRVAPLLPGVRRRRGDPDTVMIRLGTARWLAVELFHLLGYRRRRRVGRALVMSRRPAQNPVTFEIRPSAPTSHPARGEAKPRDQ